MPETSRANRGPAAAEENRRALLEAAREVFAEGGLDAPMSRVAQVAGVGQGSLYRHFPDRLDLALSVFEDNVLRLEVLAAKPDSTLGDLLDFLTDRSIESVAFVEMITPGTENPRMDEIAARILAAFRSKIVAARESGELRPDVDENQLLLAVGMVANLVAKTPASDRRSRADAAWWILNSGLRLPNA